MQKNSRFFSPQAKMGFSGVCYVVAIFCSICYASPAPPVNALYPQLLSIAKGNPSDPTISRLLGQNSTGLTDAKSVDAWSVRVVVTDILQLASLPTAGSMVLQSTIRKHDT